MLTAETFGIALGLFMALGVFALKTAVGNYYYLSLPGGAAGKIVFTVLVQIVYGAMFWLVFELLKHFDFFRAADSSAFLKNGAAVHLLLCAGLIYWGIRLLLRREGEKPDRMVSRGWLLLTVPCPVCASAIFLVCAFAWMLFPDFAVRLRWLIPLFFLLANLLFLGGLRGCSRVFRLEPLVLTGRMMIFIGVYFILILLIAPVFQEAGRLYAAARASGSADAFPVSHMGTVILAGAVMLVGFLWNFRYGKGS